MGTTPDCGPHCTPPTPTHHETHCSCSQCHGKPVRQYPSPFAAVIVMTDPDWVNWVYYGGRWTPEEGWQPLEMVSAYPEGFGKQCL